MTDTTILEPTLDARSHADRIGVAMPASDVPAAASPPAELLRRGLRLPELSQLDVVRHYTRLSQLNWSIDTHMYPLGSCTMKLNPKVNDAIAAMPGFAQAHPMQPAEDVQGALAVMHRLQRTLAEITGMAETSLAPLAGAQGELAGVLVIKAYLESMRGASAGEKRTTILVPDSAHGTNPATASMAGFDVVAVEAAARRRHGPRCAARRARRARRDGCRADDHTAEHARPLRPQHRPDRRDGVRTARRCTATARTSTPWSAR